MRDLQSRRNRLRRPSKFRNVPAMLAEFAPVGILAGVWLALFWAVKYYAAFN